MLVTVNDLRKYPDIATALQSVVRDWQGSSKYAEILRNYDYYGGKNPTFMQKLEKLRRIVLDTGVALTFGPQIKVVSSLFEQIVDKREHRVLNNPVGFDDGVSLGDDFDFRIKDMLHDALIAGGSWGHWCIDRVVPFKALEYIPIIDDDTGAMVKGIRTTQLAPDRPVTYEFFEVEGKSAFRQETQGGKLVQVQDVTPYRYTERRWGDGSRQITNASNYGVLPIVPMYVNRERRSFLTPSVKSKIDAYDMVWTFFTDETLKSNFIYFMMSGVGGTLEEVVEARNVARAVGILKASGRDSSIDAKAIEIPHDAMKMILGELRRGVFADSFTFDPTEIAGSANIATAVFAGQKPEEVSSGGTEAHVEECVKGLLKVTGQESSVNIVATPIIDDKSQTEMMMSVVDRGLPLEEALHYMPWAQSRKEDLAIAIARKQVGMSDADIAAYEEMIRQENERSGGE